MKKYLGKFLVMVVGMMGLVWKVDGQNLVPNYSFEQIDSYPYQLSQLRFVPPWFQPTLGTPDFFDNCEGTGQHYLVDVPSNFAGYQVAKTGEGYAGFFVWWVYYDTSAHAYREYIEVPLSLTLDSGVKYFVSFYVSLADSSGITTDKVGAYFSTDSVINNSYFVIPVTPQIENAAGNFIIDTSQWTQIKGTFIANGGEKFITIGNFYDNAHTDTTSAGGGIDVNHKTTGCFYIDDVCVSSDSTICYGSVGIQQPKTNLFIQISPNPFSTQLQIHYTITQPGELMVYDALGRKAKSYTLPSSQNSFELSVAELPAGIYLVAVSSGGQSVTYKVVKE